MYSQTISINIAKGHLRMKTKLQQRKSGGFTIIEVLIVLAIAGLILLVVFLAVPALNRNSRNTTIKNDASALAGGFSEYISNNDGQQPASIAQSGATITIGASTSNQAEAKVNGSTTVTTTKVTSAPAGSSYAPGTLYWRTGVTCGGQASSRAMVVYYWTETTGSTHTVSCVDAS